MPMPTWDALWTEVQRLGKKYPETRYTGTAGRVHVTCDYFEGKAMSGGFCVGHGCLVGQAAARLGIRPRTSTMPAAEAFELRGSSNARWKVAAAQRRQDDGLPWGVAVDMRPPESDD